MVIVVILLNLITFGLARSDHIKRLLLYLIKKKTPLFLDISTFLLFENSKKAENCLTNTLSEFHCCVKVNQSFRLDIKVIKVNSDISTNTEY